VTVRNQEHRMSQYPPPVPPTVPGSMYGGMKPHRGVLVLVLGILGLVLCVISGIVAWILGSTDLKEMDAGRMDPTGRSLTQAGKIIGIVAVCLNVLALLFWLAMMILGIGAAAVGGAAGGAGSP
jgi:hypothetical protein